MDRMNDVMVEKMDEIEAVVAEFYDGMPDINEAKVELLREREELSARIAQINGEIEELAGRDRAIDDFVTSMKQTFGASLSPAILRIGLSAKFPMYVGVAEKRDEEVVVRSRRAAPSDAEKEQVMAVLTREPLRLNEVCAELAKSTGRAWEGRDASATIKALIAEGKVTSQGEKRGKGYLLV